MCNKITRKKSPNFIKFKEYLPKYLAYFSYI